MLNIYKLHIFSVVARIGSFSKAAKALYLTQPAISQHISALEKQLGTPLFQRKQRGVVLTEAGETLLEYARQILWLTKAAESATMDIENIKKGSLHLGATPSASIYLIPDWVSQFRRHYPAISFSLDTNTTSKTIEGIKSQALEIGIVEGEVRDDLTINIIPLKDTELLVVIYPDHKWRELDSVSIQSLSEEPFILRRMNSQTRNWVNRLLAEYEVIPQIAIEFDDPESIKRAIIRKMGISILPACAVQDEIRQNKLLAIPLKEKILKRKLKCVYSSEYPLSAIGRAFINMLSEKFPALVDISVLPQALKTGKSLHQDMIRQ